MTDSACSVQTFFHMLPRIRISARVDARARRPPPCTLFVEIDGVQVSLRSLARTSGINYWTLYYRHMKNPDPMLLLEPVDLNKSHRRVCATSV